jgi:hypothetical protein
MYSRNSWVGCLRDALPRRFPPKADEKMLTVTTRIAPGSARRLPIGVLNADNSSLAVLGTRV